MADYMKPLQSLNFAEHVGLEDFTDKLSFLLTSGLLAVGASLTSIRTYIMQPLTCHVASPYTNSHSSLDKYVNDFCWAEGTYAVAASKFRINQSGFAAGLSRYSADKITYYQWVPLMLALQSLFCLLPRAVWNLISSGRVGADLLRIVQAANKASKSDGETRKKQLEHVTRMLLKIVQSSYRSRLKLYNWRNRNCDSCDRKKSIKCRVSRKVAAITPVRIFSSRLLVLFSLVKISYLANAIAQIVLLQKFLAPKSERYRFFGWKLLMDLLDGKDWRNEMAFPRIGSCAVFIRGASGGNWLYAQCMLPVNMLNEKLYVFYSIWFFALAVLSGVSLALWCKNLLSKVFVTKFLKNYMKLADNYKEFECKKYQRFCKFVGSDAAFTLKMISWNCGDLFCSDLVRELWRDFVENSDAGKKPTRFKKGILCLSGQLASDKDDEEPLHNHRILHHDDGDDAYACEIPRDSAIAAAAAGSKRSCSSFCDIGKPTIHLSELHHNSQPHHEAVTQSAPASSNESEYEIANAYEFSSTHS